MLSFNLYYLLTGIVLFSIAAYITRWIFKIDEINANINEQTDILNKFNDPESKENN